MQFQHTGSIPTDDKVQIQGVAHELLSRDPQSTSCYVWMSHFNSISMQNIAEGDMRQMSEK